MNKSNKDGRLPLTRKEQIWYLIKNEVGILFLANFTTFLFVLPLIVVFMFGATTYYHYTLTEGKTALDFFNVFLMYGLLAIPGTVLVGLGKAGLNAVIKQLVFESTAKYSTFFKGIIRNFKSFFVTYLILGILTATLVINFGYLRYIEGNMVFKGILFGANTLLLVTLLIALPNIEFEGSTFNNYMFAYIRNGVYMFYKSFPISLLNLLLISLPIILVCFIPIKVFFIPLGILATFYLSLSTLLIYIISISSYEKHIPKEKIKDIYHKGLEDINI